MALTAKQKNDVLFYLGYSGQTIIENSTDYITSVADRLSGVDANTETRTIRILSKLDGMDQRLEDAADRLPASQVSDIRLNVEEIPMLRKERRRLTQELGRLLDIKPQGGGGMMVDIIA